MVRVYEYNAQDPDSGDGRHLLLLTELHGKREYRTSTVIAHRLKEDSHLPQSKLLMEEHAYKRLQLLEANQHETSSTRLR
jgi:cleavage and polyadenylation specificity factor subunit 1